MKLLLIDLDSTLIDLSVFVKGSFAEIALVCDMSIDEVLKIYNEVKLLDNWPEILFQKLFELTNTPVTDIAKIFEEHMENIRLNMPIADYLDTFDGQKYIFSRGPQDFQMKKIKQFNLDKKVDGIFITKEKKIDYLKQFVIDKSFIIDKNQFNEVEIMDNDIRFLNEVNTEYPWIKTVNPSTFSLANQM